MAGLLHGPPHAGHLCPRPINRRRHRRAARCLLAALASAGSS
jgi:hypothetical protein